MQSDNSLVDFLKTCESDTNLATLEGIYEGLYTNLLANKSRTFWWKTQLWNFLKEVSRCLAGGGVAFCNLTYLYDFGKIVA